MLRVNRIPATAFWSYYREKSFYTVKVDLSVTPGEPRVMYDRDGSGYPGSDPEICSVNAVTLDEYQISKSEQGWDYFNGRPDWEDFLIKVLTNLLESGKYDYELLELAELNIDDEYC